MQRACNTEVEIAVTEAIARDTPLCFRIRSAAAGAQLPAADRDRREAIIRGAEEAIVQVHPAAYSSNHLTFALDVLLLPPHPPVQPIPLRPVRLLAEAATTTTTTTSQHRSNLN